MSNNKSLLWFVWVTLALSLAIPVFLAASMLGQSHGPFEILLSLGLLYVFVDIGRTVITLPPSKVLAIGETSHERN